jgi:hypothetical protein
MQALRTFPTDAEVAKHACGAIGNVGVGSNDRKDSLASAGACEAVVLVLRIFPTNGEVVAKACGAIESICRTSQSIRQRCRDAGAQAVLEMTKGSAALPEEVRERAQQTLQKVLQ